MPLVDPLRLGLAAAIALLWLWLLWRSRARPAPAVETALPLVLFASQSGQAEQLAQEQADRLGVRAAPLDSLRPEALEHSREAWFFLATSGTGGAPDNAHNFAQSLGQKRLDLSALRYRMLALGDRSYPDFCAFGRAVDDWLGQQGAVAAFPRIDVDRGGAQDLARWAQRVAPPDSPRWHLESRQKLTAAQDDEPAYRICLTPSQPVDWSIGAIADLSVFSPDGHPQRRSYSVASLAQTGAVELIVRQRRDDAGRMGLGSGWLTAGLQADVPVDLRLRHSPHLAAFQNAIAQDRPLLFLASGTGLAAALGPLREALASDGTAPLWLIHGERFQPFLSLTHPRLCAETILSRGAAPQRLPDWIAQNAPRLQRFVAQDALVFLAGSAQAGAANLAALENALPAATIQTLLTRGQLLTDFY